MSAMLSLGRVWLIALPAALLLAGCGSSPGRTTSIDRDHPATVAAAATATSAPSARGVTPLPSFDGAAVTIEIAQFRYTPQEVRIKAGQSVSWTFNDGAVPHTVTAFDSSFDSGILTTGSFTLRFDKPGAYCYQCAVHPGLNLCAQGASFGAAGLPLLLAGDGPLPGSQAGPMALAGGGGHMQGKIVVEP